MRSRIFAWPFFVWSDMAATYTAADISNIRAAIVEIAVRGVAEVEINGRRIKYTDATKLHLLLEMIVAEVNSDTYGGCMPIIFKEASG